MSIFYLLIRVEWEHSSFMSSHSLASLFPQLPVHRSVTYHRLCSHFPCSISPLFPFSTFIFCINQNSRVYCATERWDRTSGHSAALVGLASHSSPVVAIKLLSVKLLAGRTWQRTAASYLNTRPANVRKLLGIGSDANMPAKVRKQQFLVTYASRILRGRRAIQGNWAAPWTVHCVFGWGWGSHLHQSGSEVVMAPSGKAALGPPAVVPLTHYYFLFFFVPQTWVCKSCVSWLPRL